MTIVIDASVFSKLYLNEADSDVAHAFCRAIAVSDQTLAAPHLLKHEMCLATLRWGVGFDIPLSIIDAYQDIGLQLVDPPRSTWLLAEEICRSGNEKSGHPSLQDSLYHALAIETGGTLVSADTRHLAKTKSFGHAISLSDWESLDCFAVEQ